MLTQTQTPKEEFIAKYGDGPWQCPEGEEWYYQKTKAPDDTMSVLSSVFIEPLMMSLNAGPPVSDPTYGRYNLPFSPRELRIRDDRKYTCWDARVFLDERGQAAEKPTPRWVWYQVWSDEAAAKSKNVEVDLCFCHGISDYGGKISEHAERFLEAGYRLIVPDLPSHGRSTGLHCYLNDLTELAAAVYMCLADVSIRDAAAGRPSQRKTVISGQSMGGFTTILYGLQYHSSKTKQPEAGSESKAPNVVGLFALCPMIQISPESRPPYVIELVARAIAAVAGRLAFAPANKGNNSEDPWTEGEFESDPQAYHGHLRIATGLSCLKGIMHIDRHMEDLTLPFRVVHGLADRVTNPEGSKQLFARAASNDKECQLYERYEHVMLRKGRDEEDDAKRQRILDDMLTWLARVTV